MQNGVEHLLISSADRESGTISAPVINLRGNTIHDVVGVELVSATLPWNASFAGVQYITVRIPDFGNTAQDSAGGNATFIIPVNEATSSGTAVYYEQSEFAQRVHFGGPRIITSFRIILVNPVTGAAVTPGADWSFILRVIYARRHVFEFVPTAEEMRRDIARCGPLPDW